MNNPKIQIDLSLQAIVLLGEITQLSQGYGQLIEFPLPKETEVEDEDAPTTAELAVEIFDAVISHKDGNSNRRFRIFEAWELDEEKGVALIRLSKDYLTWPGVAEVVKISESMHETD